MHTKTLRKGALLLVFWLAVHGGVLKAQTLPPFQVASTGTNPVDFEFRADGTLFTEGNFGVGSLLSTDQGSGTKLLWFPSVAAFRAGAVSTTASLGSGPWDSPQLGSYSAAFGFNTVASGTYTAAFGYQSQATGEGATVTGWNNSATNTYAVSMGGQNNASGASSVAMGSLNTASGNNSVAVGVGNTASGFGSSTFGSYNTASGGTSTASGYSNLAYNAGTTVFGAYSTANGANSAATGVHLTVSAAYEYAIGTYNVGGGNMWGWDNSDPLFEVGNGTSTTHSDALVVYKNGNVEAQGVITAAPGGDIPMYTGH